MNFETINVGVAPTGTGGDTVRSGFEKHNRNFQQLNSSLKDRAFQADGSLLQGYLSREVAQVGLGYVTSFTIKTKIPAGEASAPLLKLQGCASGYTSPVTIDLSWYFYQGVVNSGFALVNATSPSLATLGYFPGSSMQIIVYAENGLTNLYIKFPLKVYLPRFALSVIDTGNLNMPLGEEKGWTITGDLPAPASGLVQSPLTIINTLNTSNCKVGNDGTIKVA
ncbi:hypothetical protein [Pseudomonas sp. R32]|uniref:hypothetical protein n=1 Tax=Pseudomonas sp. R32 TaxID=1573704 RepID=UPI00132E7F67|nr:hypothetical protein [Pseudomonas sp. R32]QHF27379.1 hypothetical protein PspR32_06020 [Pseudomonas sp. R32]